jgi:hypothetical protein
VMKKAKRCNKPRGFMALEMAALCAVMLPLGLLSLSLYGLTHDENLLQNIPESLTRETAGRFMNWRSDGELGVFDLNLTRARTAIERLRDSAISELSQGAFEIKDLSAKACYWFHAVDTESGGIESAAILSDCVEAGPLSAGLVLDGPKDRLLLAGVARPAFSSGEMSGFLPRLVLLGVAVGARHTGLIESFRVGVVQHGVVWVPREDVQL